MYFSMMTRTASQSEETSVNTKPPPTNPGDAVTQANKHIKDKIELFVLCRWAAMIFESNTKPVYI